MNYQTNSKYRKFRHKLALLSASLSFNFIHLRASHRLVILGQVMIIATLFFPWFVIYETQEFGIFSTFLNWVGVFIVLSAALLSGVILSNRTKEIVKEKLGIPLSDPASILFFWVLQGSLILISINFLQSLVFFTKDIKFQDAPVYALVWSILIVAGGVFAYREQKKEVLRTMYIENSQTSDALFEEYRSLLEKTPTDKKNMSLPV